MNLGARNTEIVITKVKRAWALPVLLVHEHHCRPVSSLGWRVRDPDIKRVVTAALSVTKGWGYI